MSLHLSLGLVLLLLVIAVPCTAIEYYVSATGGAPCPSGTICHSLSYYVKYSYLYFSNNDTTFYFMEGTHILDNILRVTGVSNLALIGLSSVLGYDERVTQLSAVIKCPEGTYNGIELYLSDGVLFSNIALINCSTPSPLYSAISMYHVTNVELRHVAVEGSEYGVLLSNTCSVKILMSSFVRNFDHISIAFYSHFVADEECRVEVQDSTITGAIRDGLSIIDNSTSFDNRHNNNNISIIIDRVYFSSNTRWPLLVLLTTTSRHNFVVNNSHIVDNGRGISVSGTASAARLTIEGSSLTGNRNPTMFTLYQYTDIVITSCYFGNILHNQALFFSSKYDSNSVHVTLFNVTIANNSQSYNPLAIFWTMKSVIISNCNFSYNTDSPLSLYQTHIVFKGVTVFEGNVGYNGGAIQMDGSSQIEIYDDDTKMIFMNNHAVNHGGAIYIIHNKLFHVPFCTYSHTLSKNTTIFYFSNNTADKAGSVFYGYKTGKCGDTSISSISNFTNQHGLSVVSSDAETVCLCDNNSRPLCQLRNKTFTRAPGEVIDSITVAAVGTADGLTDGILEITDELVTFDQKVSAQCIQINYTIRVADIGINMTKISLSPIGYTSYVPRTFLPLELIVSIKPCAHGFHLSSDKYVCQCDSRVSSVAKCHSSSGTVTRGGNMWLAYNEPDSCTTVHNGCPFDYCETGSITFSLSDPDTQCSLNRAGRLCGGCTTNYSLSLGSNKCQQCSANVISTPLLVILFALAGIALIALLIALNLTVSVGTINGLIFYANIVKLYEPIFFPNGPIIVLSHFISWLNLDLGIQTCFYAGMTSCHKMWLQFIFPFYIWALIIIVIIACHYSFKVTRIVGNNAVPVLATLLLLSYTKLLRTIILILSLTRVSCDDSTELYWSVDPNILYLRSCHLPLFIVALLLLSLLVVPCTIFFLTSQVRCKWQFLLKWYNKSKPFIDAYGGPYREKFQFWTGVLVLLRVVLALVVALTDDPTIASNALLVIIAMYIMMLNIAKVYKRSTNQVLDIWSSLSLVSIGYLARGRSDKLNAYFIMAIMSCNVVIFIIILAMHCYVHTCICKCCRKIRSRSNGEMTHVLGRSIIIKPNTDNIYAQTREPLLDEV